MILKLYFKSLMMIKIVLHFKYSNCGKVALNLTEFKKCALDPQANKG